MQVLASPTDNMGTLLSAIHSVNIGGVMKLSNALQVAQLALKHRRNKTGAGLRTIVDEMIDGSWPDLQAPSGLLCSSARQWRRTRRR